MRQQKFREISGILPLAINTDGITRKVLLLFNTFILFYQNLQSD